VARIKQQIQQWVVSAWVRTPEGILMLRRSSHFSGLAYGQHLWEPPGGKVEFNESPGFALARELAEETGILLHEDTVPAATCNYLVSSDTYQCHRIHIFYQVTLAKPVVPVLSTEHYAYRYVQKPGDIESLDMIPALKDMVQQCSQHSPSPTSTMKH
jgi:8-oxo-dGTP pyrophosphatase MutT (NUDIX family)